MRMPLDKIYRAFPELDRFSDEQCAAYVRLAKRERLGQRLGVIVLGLVIFAVGFGVLMGAGSGILFGVYRLDDTRWMALVATSMIVFAAGCPLLLVLRIRDRWLRRAVRLHLKSAHCPACAYLLLGLPVSNGSVRCPECGDVISLEAIGLTPENLLAPSEEGAERSVAMVAEGRA
jgi:cytochrome c biogenesis protein CcdA